jgi:deoxyhypusine monooxygenase
MSEIGHVRPLLVIFMPCACHGGRAKDSVKHSLQLSVAIDLNDIYPTMAIPEGTTVATLRDTLCAETTPLAKRFRALFSLKHVASAHPPTSQTVPAIEAIAAAFASPSALLKHELAYCLGQTRNDAAVPHLTKVLEDKEEDPMCRHEAAEALGALGDQGSLPLLRRLRDDDSEEVVVKETCEIAIERVEWEHDAARRTGEQLKQRYTNL